MAAPWNCNAPFGSARFAEPEEVARLGLLRQQPDSMLVGFLGRHRLWYSGMGGMLLVAGARSGKLRDLLAFNLCSGIYFYSMVVLDMKGELAAISRDLTPDRKFAIYWNPAGLHGLLRHRINPVDHLRQSSPTLVSDTKVFCENLIAASGSTHAKFFEGRAREILEAIVLTLVRLNGVLTLPDLYRVLNLLVAGGEAWLDFAFEMAESGSSFIVRIEEEIAAARDDPSGGFRGILGELMKGFACLSDPVLLESVSPPFDFSFAQLCESARAFQVYLMCPAEFVDAWAPVLKTMFVSAMAYKARHPDAPRQTWILDECAQLGAFPLVVKLFTYGAGIGIRPVGVFQSAKQMKALGPDAETIISSSAALQCWFGVRDLESASLLSRRIGAETLTYIDRHRQAAALHAQQRAAQALFAGGDPVRAGMELAHHARVARLPVLTQRSLRCPDEVLGMPSGKQIIFADGLAHPIYADRRAYYDQPFMDGRYHPNPFYPPLDRVRVAHRGGHAWRRVIVERVPDRFAHYPQYADGTWSRVR